MPMDDGLRVLVERCSARFAAWKGRGPAAVAWAPGRVNLIGEHTDYNEGFVLPMGIDRWCVAAGSLADGVEGEVRTSGFPGGDVSARYGVDAQDALGLAGWARYPVGALWTLKNWEGTGKAGLRGVDVMLCSSVPIGAGLSSSAAVEVAVARLGAELWGMGVRPERLAAIAREAENRIVGVPCGVMDQMVSACASEGSAMLLDCRSMAVRAVRLPVGVAVVVADSGVRHALASGEYAKRAAACRRAAEMLGVVSLRDVDEGMLGARGGGLGDEELRCARHVVRENGRVVGFVAAVERGDLAAAGRLMVESHVSLRDEFRVSCAEVDEMVEAAVRVPGVLGSRMTGGGFGGCTVTLCEIGASAEVCRVLGETTKPRGAVEPFVARAVGGAGVRRLA